MADPRKSHVNAVVCDSDWESELARCIERNPHVLAYVKNQGLQFEVPYRDGATCRVDTVPTLSCGSTMAARSR